MMPRLIWCNIRYISICVTCVCAADGVRSCLSLLDVAIVRIDCSPQWLTDTRTTRKALEQQPAVRMWFVRTTTVSLIEIYCIHVLCMFATNFQQIDWAPNPQQTYPAFSATMDMWVSSVSCNVVESCDGNVDTAAGCSVIAPTPAT